MSQTVLDTAMCSNLEELISAVEDFAHVAAGFRQTNLSVATTSEVSLALLRDDRTKLITIKIVSAA